MNILYILSFAVLTSTGSAMNKLERQQFDMRHLPAFFFEERSKGFLLISNLLLIGSFIALIVWGFRNFKWYLYLWLQP